MLLTALLQPAEQTTDDYLLLLLYFFVHDRYFRGFTAICVIPCVHTHLSSNVFVIFSANAIFYGKEPGGLDEALLRGVLSSLITIPTTVIFIFFFRNIRFSSALPPRFVHCLTSV